jgi:hypothetical protein
VSAREEVSADKKGVPSLLSHLADDALDGPQGRAIALDTLQEVLSLLELQGREGKVLGAPKLGKKKGEPSESVPLPFPTG